MTEIKNQNLKIKIKKTMNRMDFSSVLSIQQTLKENKWKNMNK